MPSVVSASSRRAVFPALKSFRLVGHTLPLLLLRLTGALALAAAPEALEGGATKRHEVVLDTEPETPMLLIRELPGHREVGRIEWPGDPTGGDEQPLRTHAKVLWQPAGEAVAINTHERFYSHTIILVRQPATGRFAEVQFPSYQVLTGFREPDTEQLRPRGYAAVVRWTTEGYLVHDLQFSPEATYSGPDPLRHRITLEVTPEGMKVIRREPFPDDL